MAFTGAYLTIVYTVLLHFTVLGTDSRKFNFVDIDIKLTILLLQGFVFISYPLIGLLADIKMTCYQMICLSCWILFVSYAILSILINLTSTGTIIFQNTRIPVTVGSALIFAIAIVGKGMFESTVIQFGTDQMIEASSNQLSTFIHWYYWSLYIGNICIDIIAAGILEYLRYCHIQRRRKYVYSRGLITYSSYK